MIYDLIKNQKLLLTQHITTTTSATCLLLSLLFLSSCADNLMFYPPHASYTDAPDILKLKTTDGQWISALYIPNKTDSYVLLFSHGNSEDIGQNRNFFELCRQNGFSVLAYDYRGYGTSQGRPSEHKTYKDIEAAYDYLVNTVKTDPNKIIIHGRSIGCGPSIYLAWRKSTAGLILESPFVSAYRVVISISFLPFDPYNNLNRIKCVRCPVLVIHGTEDHFIPLWHSRKLFDAVQSPKMCFWIQGAGHNNLLQIAGEYYWTTIHAFEEMINEH
jgi:fermentation-respiration switch protein FrsA (DUF1100 family)